MKKKSKAEESNFRSRAGVAEEVKADEVTTVVEAVKEEVKEDKVAPEEAKEENANEDEQKSE